MPIKIKNWSSYQSYKDRKPPWIRFHKSMLDNFEFHALSADARALLPMLWLLASEDEDPVSGLIRYSYEKISFRIRLPIDILEKAIQELIKTNFIESTENPQCNESVIPPLRKSYETVTPEREKEKNKKENTKKKKEPQTEFIIPEWLKPFEKDWLDFLAMRVKIRKPATYRAKELLVAKLEGFKNQGFDVSVILQQSITNDWQDLYEPKNKPVQSSTQYSTPSNPNNKDLLPDAIKAKHIKQRRDKYGQTLETGQEIWLRQYEEKYGVIDINV